MTISTTARKAGPFSGTGAQKAYPFSFKVFAASDVLVVQTDASGVEHPLVLTAQYSVSLNADQDRNPGGTVTLQANLPVQNLLTISSAVPLTQSASIPNMGGFYPKVVEQALDKLTIAMQQTAEMSARGLRFAFSDFNSSGVLPTSKIRAGKFLAFDAVGDPVAASGLGADAGLRVDLAAPTGADLISTYGGTSVQQQLDILAYGIVNAGNVQFAGGMATSRTAGENKAALQAAIASLTRPGLVQIPAGYFNIDPGIDLGTYVVGIVGAGKYATQLGCTSGATAAYMFGLPDTTLIEYATISELGIFGGGNIVEGIRMAQCNHAQVLNNLVTGTTGNALYIGGYSNDVVGNDLFSNTGSGLYLAGTLNNINVERNRIYANDGVAIFSACSDTNAGLSINITRNAFEQNKLTAIVAFNTKGLSITDNYFERNAATGYTYLTPENITIRTDIHLLAANGTIIDAIEEYSNECAVIANNQTTPIGVYSAQPNLDAFVFTTCANNLRITNNQVFDTTKINAMVALYGNREKSKIIGDLIIEGNSVDTISMVGTVDANTQLHATAHLVRTAALGPKNAAPQNFLEWGVITGSTGTFVRSAAGFKGAPVFELGDGDRMWGFTVDLSKYPELRGQYVWFGCWVNTQGNLTNARLISGGQSSSGPTDYDNDAAWKFKSVCRKIEVGESTPFFGIQKVGTGAALLIAHPVVAAVGMAYSRFSVPTDVVWKRAFYPLDGTWSLGDTVQNITPTVGQPKEWKCTAAGSPGTWVSTGNL